MNAASKIGETLANLRNNKKIVVEKPDPGKNVVFKQPIGKSPPLSRIASPELPTPNKIVTSAIKPIQMSVPSASGIEVALRIRPLNQREIDNKSNESVKIVGNKSLALETKQFTYDYVYKSTSQQQIFTDLGIPLVNNAFNGFNCSVFAYGQTSSGKTYTMMGTQTDSGLIPRICINLFETSNTSTNIQISYVEIYDEKIYDLLNINNFDKIEVKEHPKKGIYIDNATLVAVSDYNKMKLFIDKGNQARTVGETKMNRESSRSHAILTIYIEQSTNKGILRSKINLVDLAGSERVKRSGVTGKGLKEAAAINQSLSTLSRVIETIVDNQTNKKKQIPPFRESKLTMMLKECIGGNSKTIMIANISPASDSIEETMSTLNYANSVKKIINNVQINIENNTSLVESLQQEIENLKKQIDTGKTEKGTKISNDEIVKLKEQLQQAEKLHKDANTSWEEKLQSSEKLYGEIIQNLKKSHEEEKHKLVVESQKRVDDILHTRRLSEEVGAQKFQLDLYTKQMQEYKDSIEILQMQLNETKTTLSTTYTIHAKEKDALTSEIVEIRKKHQENLQKINQSREIEMAYLRDKYETLLSEQKKETESYKTQVAQMSVKHQSQKDHLAKQLDLEKKLYEEKITKELTDIYSKQEEAYEQQTFKKISEEVKKQFESQLKLKILENQQQLDEAYKQKYSDLIQSQQKEIETLKSDYERKIQELQQEHSITLNSSLESLRMEMSAAAQANKEAFQTELFNLERTLTSTRNEADMQICKIKESNIKFAQELEKKYLGELEDLQKNYQESKMSSQLELQANEKKIKDLISTVKQYEAKYGKLNQFADFASNLKDMVDKC